VHLVRDALPEAEDPRAIERQITLRAVRQVQPDGPEREENIEKQGPPGDSSPGSSLKALRVLPSPALPRGHRDDVRAPSPLQGEGKPGPMWGEAEAPERKVMIVTNLS